MALMSKVRSMLKQTHPSLSNPSIYQPLRCFSSSKLINGVDGQTGRSKGFGFVSSPSGEEASAAIQTLDGKDLHAAADKRGLTQVPRFSSGRGTEGYGPNSCQYRSQHTSAVAANNGTIYISGARLAGDKQVKIAATKIDGIGRKKAIQICYQLGISDTVKIKDLTKYQIDQIEQLISQDHVVHWELKRGERADIERLIDIYCYRGIRHQDGLPLRGQRSHTNARTCRKNLKK